MSTQPTTGSDESWKPADAADRPAPFEAPAWHGELLAERRRASDNGEVEDLDWEVVKRELRSGQLS